jgi:hypothetical protein
MRKNISKSNVIQWAFGLLVLLTTAPANTFGQRLYADFQTRGVGFVFQGATTNGVPTNALGTSFFVAIEKPPTNSFLYLITAGHVLKDTNGTLLPQVCVRLNNRNGGFYRLWLSLRDSNSVNVFPHPEAGIDLAAIPILASIATNNQIDYKAFPIDMIATKEHIKKFNIGPGDEMFFVGLFTPFYGSTANVAIARFGRLAMLTTDRIPAFPNEPPHDYYLMEGHVFPGNSGSPAFFSLGPFRNPKDISTLIAGVVRGYYPNPAKILTVEAAAQQFAMENSGIALVIPGYRIIELLNIPELKRLRGE